MAVTAAPTRKVNPVAWMSSRRQLWAGVGRHRNRFFRWLLTSSFHGNNKLVATNHVQPRARGEFDRPGIGSQSLQFCFQRLIHVAQCLYVGLHHRKLLCGNLNFGVRAHVDRHANSDSRQQNHSENNPRGNYSAPAANLSTRTNDV